MHLAAHNRFRITAGFFCGALLAAILAVMTVACGEKEATEKRAANPAPESFTFFELGSNSVLSKAVRKNLAARLGRDAIEHRSVLDLEINYPGFLKAHFPHLDQLNQKLNSPPRERIEHNTIKLMYRYAQNKNVPFDYVELIFSNYTQTPILFREWEEATGTSFYWSKADDELIVSLVPDRFGDSEYQIVIFFTESLNQIIRTEAAEKEAREQQRAKSGKSAF
jgi:hypothetical protein